MRARPRPPLQRRLLLCLFWGGLWAGLAAGVAALARAETGGVSTWRDFREHSSITYGARFSGPALGKPFGESYNVFTSGPWPMQVFNTLDFEYRLGSDYSFGFGASAAKGLVPGVKSGIGIDVDLAWFFFHPELFIQKNNLVDTPDLNVSAELLYFLPFSSLKDEGTMIGALALDQTWTLKSIRGAWNGGFTTRIKSTFYQQAVVPDPAANGREILYVAAGHFLNYSLSPRFQLATSSRFDAGANAGTSPFFDINSATDDRAEVELYYYPGTNGTRLGAFVLCPVFNARLATTILGADLKLPL